MIDIFGMADSYVQRHKQIMMPIPIFKRLVVRSYRFFMRFVNAFRLSVWHASELNLPS